MKFQIYPAKDGFRWKLLADNNKIIADSGEAYVSQGNAHRAVKTVRKAIGNADIEVVKEKDHD